MTYTVNHAKIHPLFQQEVDEYEHCGIVEPFDNDLMNVHSLCVGDNDLFLQQQLEDMNYALVKEAEHFLLDPAPIGISGVKVVDALPLSSNVDPLLATNLLSCLRCAHKEDCLEDSLDLPGNLGTDDLNLPVEDICFSQVLRSSSKDLFALSPSPKGSLCEGMTMTTRPLSHKSNNRPVVRKASRRAKSVINCMQTKKNKSIAHQKKKPTGAHIRSHQNEQWQERLNELLHFKDNYGHCVVPYHYKINGSSSLVQWVKRQRHQLKLRNEGLHSTMTDERKDLLDLVGFVWDSHSATWEERLNEVVTFKEKFGHCNVPAKYNVNPQLAVWVKCQRRQFKLFCSGEKSNMDVDRIARLSDLGFVWNPRSK